MGAQGPVLSPNDDPNPSQGQQKRFMKNRISENFHMLVNSPPSVKTAESSLARGHMWGADWRYVELRPKTPPWVRGSIYKNKALQDPGPNTHTAATICKEVLTPPTPTPGTQVPGGGGVRGQNQKNHWGIIFGPKMMILQSFGRQKSYVGVCYANDPQKGGYTMPAPTLGLTTSLRVDLVFVQLCS